jgi:hypothetical protein
MVRTPVKMSETKDEDEEMVAVRAACLGGRARREQSIG